MKMHQRLFVPLVFWFNVLRVRVARRFRRRPATMRIPAELLPILEVGTIAMRYCEFAEKEPEDLKLAQRLQEVVDQEADGVTLDFVRKILSGANVVDTTYDWLMLTDGASEQERELFKAFLTLPVQNKQK